MQASAGVAATTRRGEVCKPIHRNRVPWTHIPRSYPSVRDGTTKPGYPYLGWDASSGYHYDDDHIYGFSHTHLSGTGIGDLGDVALLPFSGGDSIKPVATFKKDTEKATPGYYAVRLDNFGINVELTSTDRVGFHKYTYDNPKERRVLLDLGHILQPNWGHKLIGNQYLLVNDSTVEGTVKTQGWAHFHSMSYRITFSEPIETYTNTSEGNYVKIPCSYA